MKYTALTGSIIIQTNIHDEPVQNNSGLFVMESKTKATTQIAEIISVGDERDDLKIGMKILFPTDTGLKLDKGIYYLKYDDICAIVND